jgi:hypothetical protein
VSFIGLISLIAIIYSTMRSSIIAIGRNPLAKGAIYRSSAKAMALAMTIAIVASIAVFFVLR